jgi:phage repressor protein C with HTH and peptisase S24 domain
MKTQSERLAAARLEAGYADAASAARAMGVPAPTYQAHENGSRGLGRALERYAAFFRVSADWLLTGKGEMKPARMAPVPIPVVGFVHTGASVELLRAKAAHEPPAQIGFAMTDELGALEVYGDSGRPRFLPGEFILFERSPLPPQELVGQCAIVQTKDGRMLVKTLRHGRKPELWRLDSFNADPEEDVELIAAYRYRGVLPR